MKPKVTITEQPCTLHGVNGCTKCCEPITTIKPEDVILTIGDEVKKVTKFDYNPFHKGYDIEWE